jgi:ornithine decarboxylase
VVNSELVSALSPPIARFFVEHAPPTPCLVIDLNIIARRYAELREALPFATPYYAVKSCPEPAVIKLLVDLGARFDVASRAEIDMCLSQGAAASSLSYGNTIKKSEDISYAYERGVRMFVFDNEREVNKIADAAPGAAVYCRLLAEDTGARWALGDNFGVAREHAADLMHLALKRGLVPYGLSFHVGSQQMDTTRWEPSIAAAAEVAAQLRAHGIEIEMLNIGGGFPANYAEPAAPLSCYGEAIASALQRWLPDTSGRPHIVSEPGRCLTADSGVLRTQVVSIRQPSHDSPKWIYLDAGRFGGLTETEGGAILYRLSTARSGPEIPVILAGPTCDSVDVIYRESNYMLPATLEIGDTVDFLSAGAYTASYSSIGFNGFPPLNTHIVGGPP